MIDNGFVVKVALPSSLYEQHLHQHHRFQRHFIHNTVYSIQFKLNVNVQVTRTFRTISNVGLSGELKEILMTYDEATGLISISYNFDIIIMNFS